MRPLRYSINVTLDGCCDHREIVPDEELHRHAVQTTDGREVLPQRLRLLGSANKGDPEIGGDCRFRLWSQDNEFWMDHGALEYRECVGDDMTAPGMVAFPKLAKSKPDEVVIFAYVVFKSRQHRDATNKKIFADPRLNAMCDPNDMPFDCKRMARGGFKTLVEV